MPPADTSAVVSTYLIQAWVMKAISSLNACAAVVSFGTRRTCDLILRRLYCLIIGHPPLYAIHLWGIAERHVGIHHRYRCDLCGREYTVSPPKITINGQECRPYR